MWGYIGLFKFKILKSDLDQFHKYLDRIGVEKRPLKVDPIQSNPEIYKMDLDLIQI